jgi:uncharacterized lipoprotein NlpE involved in copper resistance
MFNRNRRRHEKIMMIKMMMVVVMVLDSCDNPMDGVCDAASSKASTREPSTVISYATPARQKFSCVAASSGGMAAHSRHFRSSLFHIKHTPHAPDLVGMENLS